MVRIHELTQCAGGLNLNDPHVLNEFMSQIRLTNDFSQGMDSLVGLPETMEKYLQSSGATGAATYIQNDGGFIETVGDEDDEDQLDEDDDNFEDEDDYNQETEENYIGQEEFDGGRGDDEDDDEYDQEALDDNEEEDCENEIQDQCNIAGGAGAQKSNQNVYYGTDDEEESEINEEDELGEVDAQFEQIDNIENIQAAFESGIGQQLITRITQNAEISQDDFNQFLEKCTLALPT